jgi:polyhydroxybutyrate depolymerase
VRHRFLGLLLLTLAACSRAGAPSNDAAPRSPLVVARPYALTIPRALDRTRPAPLVVMLHGYGSNGHDHAEGWGLPALAEREGFVLASPDGTLDSRGGRFWNATDACCDFDGVRVDDVAYLGALIDDASRQVSIDARRVYVVGHSNGGFMAHRLACEMSQRVAAVVSLAGAGVLEASRCQPRSPVAIAQVHGTRDTIVRPAGGTVFGQPLPPYPSVERTTGDWATRLLCAGPPARGVRTLDLDASLPGAETRVDRWSGCRASLELWTIEGGAHVPALTPAWGEALWAFLKANPKPKP